MSIFGEVNFDWTCEFRPFTCPWTSNKIWIFHKPAMHVLCRAIQGKMLHLTIMYFIYSFSHLFCCVLFISLQLISDSIHKYNLMPNTFSQRLSILSKTKSNLVVCLICMADSFFLYSSRSNVVWFYSLPMCMPVEK